MDALVRDDHPRRQVTLERGKRVEVELRKAIPLRVFHAGFSFALRPRTIRGARARLHVPVPTEREIGRLKHDGARGVIASEYQRARIVAEDRPRHTTEMGEGGRDALAPIILSLIQKG